MFCFILCNDLLFIVVFFIGELVVRVCVGDCLMRLACGGVVQSIVGFVDRVIYLGSILLVRIVFV